MNAPHHFDLTNAGHFSGSPPKALTSLVDAREETNRRCGIAQ